MIYSFYEHGGDQPATGLGAAQIAGASRDPAGTLWVDLEAPTAAERTSVLAEALGFERADFPGLGTDAAQGLLVGPRHSRLVARVPGDQGSFAALVLYVSPNVVVTEHPGLPALHDMRTRADTALPDGGALGLAGWVLGAVSAACAVRLADLDRKLTALEAGVVGSAGRTTGRELYALRRELEVLSESLPTLASACRELATSSTTQTGGQSSAAGSPGGFLEPAALTLERQARVARRLSRRGDLAMAAHASELQAALVTWSRRASALAAVILIVLIWMALMSMGLAP
jgi:hypothetical protein